MLADLFMTPGKGVAEQLTYWAHTYLPFSRWKKPIDEVIDQTSQEAGKYGISVSSIDRRRAYQVARMLVPNRRGEHLADLTPDAYNVFSPTCCAKSHQGKKKIAAPDERRAQYLQHPETLAYLLTPTSLARLGIGGSAPGTLVGVPMGAPTPPAGVIASDLLEESGGKGSGAIDAFAKIVAALHTGLPEPAEEESAAA